MTATNMCSNFGSKWYSSPFREEIKSGPEAVEEGRQDIKPRTSDSVQRESGGQGDRQDGRVKG